MLEWNIIAEEEDIVTYIRTVNYFFYDRQYS